MLFYPTSFSFSKSPQNSTIRQPLFWGEVLPLIHVFICLVIYLFVCLLANKYPDRYNPLCQESINVQYYLNVLLPDRRQHGLLGCGKVRNQPETLKRHREGKQWKQSGCLRPTLLEALAPWPSPLSSHS